jgi:hypothetical protein
MVVAMVMMAILIVVVMVVLVNVMPQLLMQMVFFFEEVQTKSLCSSLFSRVELSTKLYSSMESDHYSILGCFLDPF